MLDSQGVARRATLGGGRGKWKPARRENDGEAVRLVPPPDDDPGSNPDLPRYDDHPRHVSRVCDGMDYNRGSFLGRRYPQPRSDSDPRDRNPAAGFAVWMAANRMGCLSASPPDASA